jgi:hypothetical protein
VSLAIRAGGVVLDVAAAAVVQAVLLLLEALRILQWNCALGDPIHGRGQSVCGRLPSMREGHADLSDGSPAGVARRRVN